MKNEPEIEAEIETIEVHPDGRSATGKALHLFGVGVFAGLLTMFGVGVVLPNFVHSHSHCHGATASQREAEAETRRRCLELGVTPDELAALDADAARHGGE